MQQATFGRRNAALQLHPRPQASRPAPTAKSALPAMPALSNDLPRDMDAAVAGASADETEMMRYLGGNWPKYRTLWRSMNNGADLKMSFSFAAFFFTTFWLLYRKLYAWAFGIFGAGVAIGFIIPNKAWLFQIVASAVLGLYGKALVVRRGMSTVENLKSMGLSTGEAALRIEKAGGTNFVAAVSVAVLFGLIGVVGAVGAAGRHATEKDTAAAMRRIATPQSL